MDTDGKQESDELKDLFNEFEGHSLSAAKAGFDTNMCGTGALARVRQLSDH
jgi:hypothetical protein